MHFISWIC